jgi:hypothetical protein
MIGREVAENEPRLRRLQFHPAASAFPSQFRRSFPRFHSLPHFTLCSRFSIPQRRKDLLAGEGFLAGVRPISPEQGALLEQRPFSLLQGLPNTGVELWFASLCLGQALEGHPITSGGVPVPKSAKCESTTPKIWTTGSATICQRITQSHAAMQSVAQSMPFWQMNARPPRDNIIRRTGAE